MTSVRATTAAAIACPFCGDAGERHLVSTTVWGAPNSSVYQCSVCEIIFVHPIMDLEEERRFYEAQFAHYMRERGGPGETQPAEHFAKNGPEAARRLANLTPVLRPEWHVLEVGSSTGFLLDAVRPFVASVSGVEPGQLYREYANGRGLTTFPDLREVSTRRFDLILAYYVVEHLQRPIESLRHLHGMLAEGGRLAVEVPNVDDALVRFYRLESFDRFYWQKAHYFNYSHRTLQRVLEQAGFTDIRLFPEQRYDFSNHLHWFMKGEPGGKGKYTDIFDQRFDEEYARCLKARWLCDTIFALATRGTP